MAGEIQALYYKYKQEHPERSMSDIVDIMLDDGVITYSTAKKLKSGLSVFVIENDFLSSQKDADNIFGIMGLNFNNKKTEVTTNFNQKIEATFQSSVQGDCWLLSDINSLNCTDWGRKAIHDAIMPDEDGSGGVTIKFKGSPLEQKEFHFTADVIQNAKDSGKYSTGDDDMIALELATEETFKCMVKSGLGKRVDDFDDLMGWKSYLFGVMTDEIHNQQIQISNLLGIETIDVHMRELTEEKSLGKAKEKILKYLANNFDKTANSCAFVSDICDSKMYKNEKIHSNHAYAIKKLEYGSEVVVIDPYHADKEIKLTWDKFLKYVQSIYTRVPNKNARMDVCKALPDNYEQNYRENAKLMYYDRIKYKLEYETERRLEEFKREKQKAECEKEKELKRQVEVQEKVDKALNIVDNAITKNDGDIIFNSNISEIFNEETILPILEKYPNIILWIDKLYYGLGNGKDKSLIMSHIIDSLAKLANKNGLDYENKILPFKRKCNHELNAIFYTNEKVIQNEVEKMVKSIQLMQLSE